MKHFQIQNFNDYQILRRLLTLKLKEKGQKRIPLVLKYNKTLLSVKQIINKHWHLLQINSNLRNAFTQESLIAYRGNKNLGDLIGSKQILDGEVLHENNRKKQLYSRPYLNRRDNNCCQQDLETNTFTISDWRNVQNVSSVKCTMSILSTTICG